jgi:LacI family transcriptional regulator
VALAIDRGSPVLPGIIEYLQTHRRWACTLVDPTDKRLAGSIDGLIVAPPPSGSVPQPGIDPHRIVCIGEAPAGWTAVSTVRPDYQTAGRLAAEHLLNRGLQHVGVVGDGPGLPATAARGFADRVSEAGLEAIKLPGMHDQRAVLEFVGQTISDAAGQPVGLFAGDDQQAMALINGCLAAGLAIPEQVAVVGMGNHPMVCRLAGVAVSSVDLDGPSLGRSAAGLLDERMNGPAGEPQRQYVSPIGVVERASTRVLAVGDDLVAEAMRRINHDQGLRQTVQTLSGELGVSRWTLDRRFKAALGRTTADQIALIRIERARHLLRQTTLSMAQIAGRAGFSDLNHLGRSFKRHTGQSPSEYRAERSAGA